MMSSGQLVWKAVAEDMAATTTLRLLSLRTRHQNAQLLLPQWTTGRPVRIIPSDLCSIASSPFCAQERSRRVDQVIRSTIMERGSASFKACVGGRNRRIAQSLRARLCLAFNCPIHVSYSPTDYRNIIIPRVLLPQFTRSNRTPV